MVCLAVLRPFCPRQLAAFSRRAIWFYGRGMLFWLRPWLPVHLRRGDLAVRFPASVMVCNHQSFLDIYLLGAQDQANLCLVTKSWPFRRLFFFAPIMRCARYIDVESLPVEQAEALCLQRLQEGATLVFFPEGRRTKTGALGKFHSGAFRVAVRAGRPVLPLLIRNSFRASGRQGHFSRSRAYGISAPGAAWGFFRLKPAAPGHDAFCAGAVCPLPGILAGV